ncbi:MAG: NAD(P)-dependent oxidoreductase [Candidatus Hydrogenedentota bacterium]|nr:MAG: NAD(P)-dependent oxidoreductase [Candidatus Hydrogenedentota bacterium]
MKVLFTGSSSFTGYWFIRTLTEAGHEVTALFQANELSEYTGIRSDRVQQIQKQARCVTGISFGDSLFGELLAEGYDILCHHGADVTNYKSEDFNFAEALAKNTKNIQRIVSVCKEKNTQILLTSSVFEAGQGIGSKPMRAFSPYGLSKTFTREAFEYFALTKNIPLKIFTIPNPVGPYEEPRFTNYLVKTWAKGDVPSVNTPDYIRDNIPVDLLAKCYVLLAEKQAHHSIERLNPSGYVESQGEFAIRFAREFSRRLKKDLQVHLNKQTEFTEPIMRVNTDRAKNLFPDWDENKFWDDWVQYYVHLYPTLKT